MKEYYLIDSMVVQKDRVANLDDLTTCPCGEGETYEHGLTGFLLAVPSGNFGCVLGVAFAKHLEEALDIAADAELLNYIKPGDEFDPEDRYVSLGNFGDRYDLQNLAAIEFDVTNGMDQYLCHD
jgi:hypothetical protein